MSSQPRITRRRFLQVAAVGSAAGVLAGCAAPPAPAPAPAQSSAPQPQAEQAEAQPTTAPAGATQNLGGKQGTLWGLKYDPHVEAYQRLAAMFEQKTGAKLNVEPQDWPIETKVITALAAGAPPDAVCIMGKVLPPLHLQGALLPCSDLVYKPIGIDPYKDFYPDAAGAYTWNNEIWGVPVEVNGVGSMVNVPVDDVKAAKLTDQYPPTNGNVFFESYEDMYALAEALQKKEGDKVGRWGLSSQGWDSTSLLGIIRSLGVDWWDLDNKKFNVDSEAGVQALEYLVEKPVKMGIETQLDQSGIDAALQGKVAIVRGNGTPTIQGKDLGYFYEMSGAPKLNGKDPLFIGEAGWGFASPKSAKNQDIAVAFLQMVATPEGQREYSKIYGGLISSSKSLAGQFDWFKDPSPDSPNVKAAKVMLDALLPNTVFYGEQFGYASAVDGACGTVCAEVRQGKKTAAEGAKELQALLEAQYAQFQDDVKKLGS
jgi:ABC-type glycerol-3-phosphate transport system substrate-binding protein